MELYCLNELCTCKQGKGRIMLVSAGIICTLWPNLTVAAYSVSRDAKLKCTGQAGRNTSLRKHPVTCRGSVPASVPGLASHALNKSLLRLKTDWLEQSGFEPMPAWACLPCCRIHCHAPWFMLQDSLPCSLGSSYRSHCHAPWVCAAGLTAMLPDSCCRTHCHASGFPVMPLSSLPCRLSCYEVIFDSSRGTPAISSKACCMQPCFVCPGMLTAAEGDKGAVTDSVSNRWSDDSQEDFCKEPRANSMATHFGHSALYQYSAWCSQHLK
eukprot:1147844-Pelagomonas_calceolata.AAC.1